MLEVRADLRGIIAEDIVCIVVAYEASSAGEVLLRNVCRIDCGLILQVLADIWQIDLDINAMSLQDAANS